jgi:hypothetical protein
MAKLTKKKKNKLTPFKIFFFLKGFLGEGEDGGIFFPL